ncbi:hypothetical protein L1987_36848 [Smallanthus sonchifolius]|uniref:Uncharacterized protein n=1 Tax=Smallanthus sonchifolius TaxID=185202 RepID=A0ACB9HEK1_9ASTR|nr:hypothetical protein L1987_36848 [Smallanthus sonchifolius]
MSNSMESKEDVHSDDGSYEMVNSDDYASENMEEGLSDDSSYDLLCSEVSETLVLTDDEGFSEDNISDDTEGDMGLKDANDSDRTEDGGDMLFDCDPNSDSKVQPVHDSVNKVKKRDLMTMLCESSDFDLYDYPVQFKLKNDIKEVAKNHIIRYLPAKSLYKCRQVSKEWDKWISCPFFAHEQSQYFRKTSGFFQDSKLAPIQFIPFENSAYGVPNPSLGFLPVRVYIKSSCNGLLLCQSFNFEDEFFVCNPANQQWIKLPPSTSFHGLNPRFVLAFEPSSLGFEPCYQVICLFSVPYPDVGPIVHFDIYDSKTKSWTVSEMICADLESEVKSDGIFVNGVVYWETTGGELLAFDLKNEIYSVQKLPVDEGGALTNFHGELCHVRAEYDRFTRSCVLDVYGDGVMSLKNTINIPVDDVEVGELVDCTVLGNSCDDVVALVVKVSQGQECLYAYHVKDEKVQGLGVFNHSNKLFPYVNSLVSIDA